MTTDMEREAQIAVLLQRPYHKIIRGEPVEGYLAEVLELPGCLTAGATEMEALENLREAMAVWFEWALVGGHPIPEAAGALVSPAPY